MSSGISSAGQSEQQASQTEIRLSRTQDYRDSYANTVHVRMSVWDFQLIFGTMRQDSPTEVNIENFQGLYLSPQQAKALCNILGHNLAQYEQTFGTIVLEPKAHQPAETRFVQPSGPVH